jgi:hypothetical protein
MTKSQGATTSTNPSTVPETTLPVDATYPTTVAGDAPIQHKIPDEYIPGESKILTSDNQATGSAFSITRPPSQAVVAEAAKYVLVDEDGKDVVFGSLLPPGSEASTSSSDATTPHTVVFFIRHFWCGSCQDFMLHSIAKLDPDMLAAHNVKVAIIGCGGWKNIKTYRALFDCPFPLYSDTSRGLYTLMGCVSRHYCPDIHQNESAASIHRRPVTGDAVQPRFDRAVCVAGIEEWSSAPQQGPAWEHQAAGRRIRLLAREPLRLCASHDIRDQYVN